MDSVISQQILREIKDLRMILTGNGRPEGGVCFRLASVEKNIGEIKKDVDRVSQHPYVPPKRNDGEKIRWYQSAHFNKTLQMLLSYGWKIALVYVLGKDAIGL